jgi:hypothetical protein
LVRAWFQIRTGETAQVPVGGATVERPKYRLRRPMEMIDQ